MLKSVLRFRNFDLQWGPAQTLCAKRELKGIGYNFWRKDFRAQLGKLYFDRGAMLF
jgi:hypothetical protein